MKIMGHYRDSFFASRLVISTLLLAFLAACGGQNTEAVCPGKRQAGKPGYEQQESIFGQDGLVLFGGSDKETQLESGSGIAVNTFLWRASLDTVSFMPLASADPFGGVIITDWYQPSDSPGERFKVNVFILTRQLRADGLRASVFKQNLQNGVWMDAAVEKQTAIDLENAILTRARQLRIASIQ